MRLDIPIWFESYDQCVNKTCSHITQSSYINILTPDILFNLGIGAMFGFIVYAIYKHENKKEKGITSEIKSEQKNG